MNHLRLTNEGYVQLKSIPACNSSTRPKCQTEAKTAADESIAENLRHPLDTVDVRHPNRDFGYAQVKSIPACNSSTRPKCQKEAKTAADESIAENMRHPLDTVDVRHPNRDFGYS